MSFHIRHTKTYIEALSPYTYSRGYNRKSLVQLPQSLLDIEGVQNYTKIHPR